jgi:hypothetical protein
MFNQVLKKKEEEERKTGIQPVKKIGMFLLVPCTSILAYMPFQLSVDCLVYFLHHNSTFISYPLFSFCFSYLSNIIYLPH